MPELCDVLLNRYCDVMGKWLFVCVPKEREKKKKKMDSIAMGSKRNYQTRITKSHLNLRCHDGEAQTRHRRKSGGDTGWGGGEREERGREKGGGRGPLVFAGPR